MKTCNSLTHWPPCTGRMFIPGAPSPREGGRTGMRPAWRSCIQSTSSDESWAQLEEIRNPRRMENQTLDPDLRSVSQKGGSKARQVPGESPLCHPGLVPLRDIHAPYVPPCASLQKEPQSPQEAGSGSPSPRDGHDLFQLVKVSEEARWANLLLVRLVQVAEACLLRQQGSTCPTLGASSR